MALTVEIVDRVDPAEWNAFVGSHPAADLMQTTYWAETIASYHGHRPLYARATESGRVEAALLLFVEPYFEAVTRQGHPLLYTAVRSAAPVLRWKRGPVVRAAAPGAALIEGLEARVQSHRPLGVALSSCLPASVDGDGPGNAGRHASFRIDLTQGTDTLWAGMKKVARKALRRAEGQGISVRRIDRQQDLDAIWRMLIESWERLGTRDGRRRDLLDHFWDSLHPGGFCEFFLAEVGGEPVGSMGVWQYNGYLYEFYSGRSHVADEERLNVGDALKWAIMKWGSEQGHRVYDLAGVAPEPRSPKEQGIYAFKEKFGGTHYEYGLYSSDYRPVRSRLLRRLHGGLRRLRRRQADG
jgi:lipid II:glycine glycyltransferase (peptidoglycan interpeptide bridge formation enzyme)